MQKEKVVDIKSVETLEPNEGLVRKLEQFLADAKSGKCRSAIVILHNSGEPTERYHSEFDPYTETDGLLYQLLQMQRDILDIASEYEKEL